MNEVLELNIHNEQVKKTDTTRDGWTALRWLYDCCKKHAAPSAAVAVMARILALLEEAGQRKDGLEVLYGEIADISSDKHWLDSIVEMHTQRQTLLAQLNVLQSMDANNRQQNHPESATFGQHGNKLATAVLGQSDVHVESEFAETKQWQKMKKRAREAAANGEYGFPMVNSLIFIRSS